jgi:hypothetical protein
MVYRAPGTTPVDSPLKAFKIPSSETARKSPVFRCRTLAGALSATPETPT